MKKVFLVCLIYLFSLTSAFANDRDIRLNQLFNELKVNKAKVAAPTKAIIAISLGLVLLLTK